jgi:hypothetical protein
MHPTGDAIAKEALVKSDLIPEFTQTSSYIAQGTDRLAEQPP